MQNNDKKVLLRISNLKQYFPLKGGRFVKANDGITLDIYEGETFGLVGESGCGKSTLGRTILQLYHQTYGRTMYYGRSLDDLAPKYVIDTVKNLKARRTKLRELEQKRDKLEAEYAKLSEKEQYAKHGELDTARKLAEDALLDITKIVGGFLVVDDLDPVIAAYSKDYAIARKLSSMEEKRQELQVDVDDAEYAKKTAEEAGKSGKDDQLQKAQEKLKQCDEQIAALRAQLDAGRKEIEALRAPYANDPEFQKYEAYRDDGIDLARLEYNEMRRLRRDMQLIFQDPYSSLNPRMSVGQIISEGMQAHNMIKKKDARMQEMVLKIMDDCGLAPYFLHRFPHQFSGGQRQRIGLARAMVMEPELVVADEPISALDVSIRAQVLNLLKKFQKERDITYLFIAHDLSIVRFISDRIGVIYKGDIVEIAEAEELFDFPLHPYTRSLISAIPIPDPILEKNKVLFTYDPSVHDYSEDKPELVDIGNNHFVYGNKKEIEEYKAIRAKGEKVKSITILDPNAPRPEQTEQKVDENGSDAFLETPLHDTGSKWYSILSFFLPILGLIAAGVFRHFHHIRNYKACKKGAIAGLITRAVIILFFALMLVFALL